QALGLASPPSLAPPLLASSSLLVSRRRGISGRNKKKPRASGAFVVLLKMSVGAAATIAPHGAVRAAATGAYHDDRSCGAHHDDRARANHNGPAIGLAAA